MHSERCMSGSERGYRKPMAERSRGARSLLLQVKVCHDKVRKRVEVSVLLLSGPPFLHPGGLQTLQGTYPAFFASSLFVKVMRFFGLIFCAHVQSG